MPICSNIYMPKLSQYLYLNFAATTEGASGTLLCECSDFAPQTFSFSKYSETTKVPISSITHPGLWVGLDNRMIEDSELGVSSCVLLVTRYVLLKFRIVSLLASWMRELSAAKLREFYVAKRNITVIQVDMLNMFATTFNMSCTRFLRVLHIQLMSNIATIFHAVILFEYWEFCWTDLLFRY